jgi:hypothetical protein
MKFINEDGKIIEGIPLTDQQAEQRDRLVVYFHEEACGGSYHGTYSNSERKCEKLSNAFVTGEMAKIAEGLSEGQVVEPITEPAPEPASTPVPVDDVPF